MTFLGVGISLSTSSRRQSKAARLWSIYDGSSLASFPDGATDVASRTLGAGSFVNAPVTDTGTLAGVLSGTGTLTKFGTGSIWIVNSNAWTGGLVISEGNIRCGSDAALGTGPVTVQSGTTLYLNGYAIANPITNNGGTVIP